MSRLYELSAEYAEIAKKLEESGLDEQTISDTLEGLSGSLEEKIVNISKLIRQEESDAKAIIEAAKEMQARAAQKEKHAERLKAYLHENMKVSGLAKVESPWFVVSIKKNPPSLVIDDETKIPDSYMKVIPETKSPDKAHIKKALSDGIDIAFAHLEQKDRIEIK